MNHVRLSGDLQKDPEVRTLDSGTVMGKCTLVNIQGKDNRKEHCYFDVTCWGDVASSLLRFKAGDTIAVDGKLTQRRWQTPEGAKRSRVEIVAFEVIAGSDPADFQGPQGRTAAS